MYFVMVVFIFYVPSVALVHYLKTPASAGYILFVLICIAC